MKNSKKRIQDLQKEARDVLDKFEKSTQYKESLGILRDAKRSVEFYEGRQWRDLKKKLPFENPTINVVGNMVDSKAASILNKTWVINYSVNDNLISTKKINRFTEWQLKQLHQDELNVKLTYDGLNKGTMIAYFYWDEDAVGQMGVMDGAVKASVIDIQDILAKLSEKFLNTLLNASFMLLPNILNTFIILCTLLLVYL